MESLVAMIRNLMPLNQWAKSFKEAKLYFQFMIEKHASSTRRKLSVIKLISNSFVNIKLHFVKIFHGYNNHIIQIARKSSLVV